MEEASWRQYWTEAAGVLVVVLGGAGRRGGGVPHQRVSVEAAAVPVLGGRTEQARLPEVSI
jgi:hypothetical protein